VDFTFLVPMETGMNTPQNSYKIYNFTLTVSLIMAMLSAVRDDRGRLLPAVRSIELVMCNFCRQSSSAYPFTFCQGSPWWVSGQKCVSSLHVLLKFFCL